MSNFIQRIKKDINNPRNSRVYGGMVLVNKRDLHELIGHFESLDSEARANHDAKTPEPYQNRMACLAHEVQAAFHALGAEETLDTVMFTVAEIRKEEIKIRREDEPSRVRQRKEVSTFRM